MLCVHLCRSMKLLKTIKQENTIDSFFKQFIRDLSVRSVLFACAILSVCLFAFQLTSFLYVAQGITNDF